MPQRRNVGKLGGERGAGCGFMMGGGRREPQNSVFHHFFW